VAAFVVLGVSVGFRRKKAILRRGRERGGGRLERFLGLVD